MPINQTKLNYPILSFLTGPTTTSNALTERYTHSPLNAFQTSCLLNEQALTATVHQSLEDIETFTEGGEEWVVAENAERS